MIARLLRRIGETVPTGEPLPPGVAVVRIAWIPALAGRFSGMRGPAAAVTLGRTIVIHPDATPSPGLIRHELAHVRQWAGRPFAFPRHYAWLHLRHGYRDNPYEAEARRAEAGPERSTA